MLDRALPAQRASIAFGELPSDRRERIEPRSLTGVPRDHAPRDQMQRFLSPLARLAEAGGPMS